MKKKIICLILAILTVLSSIMFSSCQKEHIHSFSNWKTVKEPTCSVEGKRERECECGEKETETLKCIAHTWKSATCTSAKACSVCGATEGSPLGHKWENATCTQPKRCSVCGTTEGTAQGHTPASNMKCRECGAKLTAKDFSYLAGYDFRKIRRKYSAAEATGAYIVTYKNLDGHNCVMVVLFYKILKSYCVTTLHDLSTGDTIEDPSSYYEKTAKRYYGASALHYLDLAIEVGENQEIALKALQSIWKGGSDNGGGAYVDANYLNM